MLAARPSSSYVLSYRPDGPSGILSFSCLEDNIDQHLQQNGENDIKTHPRILNIINGNLSIQAATEVLQLPIRITDENATAAKPFLYLTHKFPEKTPMTIGHQTLYHFHKVDYVMLLDCPK